MQAEKEIGQRLIVEAARMGVLDPRIERGRKHPRLIGVCGDRLVMVVFGGSSRDFNAFSIARQHLRRQVRAAATGARA